ncbi:WYL domain-containing protein [Azohydromonas lata]|uniref:WYL domain-containing protein n=1 Tax=Azohydromonas lata TaxID=45677 RepID=A0ABU5ICV1_9BURK|nr:WYL domain-containing protein [Azohydromonas lata]MDZ5455793.1 WYL domain-containing protein [Azohydromonas lata]
MAVALDQHRAAVLAGVNKTQLERLAYIDFKLYFFGELRRADVVDRFGMGPAAATRDIAMYKDISPKNLALDNTDKVYRPTVEFAPLFEHAPQRVLTALAQGFGEGFSDALKPMIRSEIPNALGLPKMSVLAPVMRAIHRGKAIRLGYTSIDSGYTEREIVPLALVDIGIRWHVRAFDRRHRQFRDFVLTRMDAPTVLEDSQVMQDETAEHDVQWSRIIELEFVPHPEHPRPEVVRMDYSIPADGVLRVSVRAANAGYMLRRWTVDCSPDHSLRGIEYALWLRDPLALYGANNAQLAPGYKDPHSKRKIKAL